MQSSRRLRGRLACIAAGTAVAAFGFASTASADVAVFDNGSYVDTAGGNDAESDTVQATLDHLDVPFSTFTGVTAAEVDPAIAGRDAVLIPEQEEGAIANDPAAAELVSSLRSYVQGGGRLVVFGGNGDASLINAIAGTTVTQTDTDGAPLAAEADGTRFAGGPASLPYNDHTVALLAGSLPDEALEIYSDGTQAPVAVIGLGAGEIVYLGFDWYDAAPLGTQDSGWVEVLDRAIPGAPRSVSVADASMNEGKAGASGLSLTVTLSSASRYSTSVQLRTAPGTADAVDFWSISERVVFEPGQTTKNVVVPIIGDVVDEPDETFTATLSDPVGAMLGRATATATIVDDDAPGDKYPPRLAPASFTAKAAVRRDKKAPYAFVVRGKLGLPSGMAAGDGCTGFVAVRLHRGKATQTRVRPLSSDCTYRASLRVGRKGKYRAVAVFLGNHALKRVSAKGGTVRAG